jgi:hypothetical protein
MAAALAKWHPYALYSATAGVHQGRPVSGALTAPAPGGQRRVRVKSPRRTRVVRESPPRAP